eukprot:XP_023987813.1 60S ribosomal protein L10-like [Physeter catodon]
MRGAFGKPQGTVARVHIGQVIMSIRTKLQNKEHVIEALRRAKFKFPGRQKIHISKKWGFTKFIADEFENMVAEKWLIPDGCGVKYIPNHGPLDKWRALHSLACCPQSRLQTGMRGAFGKPQDTVARVHIGQVIMSIRTKLQNKEHVIEALRRAKFKFPGRQKIHISKKWGFTKFIADEFENMVAEKWLIPDGCGVKYIPNHGPLDKWRALHS